MLWLESTSSEMRTPVVHLARLLAWRGRCSQREQACVIAACLSIALLEVVSWQFWPPGLRAAVAFGTAYIAAASTTRRVHDTDRAGAVWAVAIVAILTLVSSFWAISLGAPHRPAWVDIASVVGIYLGWIPILFLFLPFDPTRGENRFGALPPWTRPEALRRVAGEADLERIRQRVRRGRRRALALRPADRRTISRLGGSPWLDTAIEWPRAKDERLLRFFAQLDLAEVRAAGGPGWLPSSGVLFFFADANDLGAPEARVLLRPRASVDPPRTSVAKPYGSRSVIMASVMSSPSLEWLGVAAQFDGADADALMRQVGAAPPSSGHRIGGYSAEIQDTPLALACELAARQEDPFEAYPNPDDLHSANLAARRQWRLLLQIESDEALGMRFGDGGRLWFFVREADARRGDFSGVRAIAQTH